MTIKHRKWSQSSLLVEIINDCHVTTAELDSETVSGDVHHNETRMCLIRARSQPSSSPVSARAAQPTFSPQAHSLSYIIHLQLSY